ncbi:hypothetical protein G6F65_014816 [Rhizopus arrhizus]|nr:hypothetical protein G6F65_014816 [Rhizopus arrhizus]
MYTQRDDAERNGPDAQPHVAQRVGHAEALQLLQQHQRGDGQAGRHDVLLQHSVGGRAVDVLVAKERRAQEIEHDAQVARHVARLDAWVVHRHQQQINHRHRLQAQQRAEQAARQGVGAGLSEPQRFDGQHGDEQHVERRQLEAAHAQDEAVVVQGQGGEREQPQQVQGG